MALNTSQAQVQINAQVTGTQQVADLRNALDGTQQSVADLTKKQQALLNSLNNQISTFGKSRSEMLAYRAAQLGITSEAEPLIQKLVQMGVDGGHGMEKLSLATAGARRELLVLAHEAATGNWKRFAGSLMVLGERINIMGLVISTLTNPLTWLVAEFGVLGYAALKGAEEQQQFNDALILTGNYAGLTGGQFDTMAQAMVQSGGRISTAKDAIMALAETGKFTGSQIALIGQAAAQMSDVTGKAVKDTVAEFVKLADDPAKASLELNDKYHYLTLAVYDQIDALERQGEKVAAADVAERAYADAVVKRTREITDNLGPLGQAWQRVRDYASGAWAAMEQLGKTPTTDDKLAFLTDTLNQTLADDKSVGAQPGGFVKKLQEQIANLQEKKRFEQRDAETQADQAKLAEQQIHAKQVVQSLHDEAGGWDLVAKKIQEYRSQVALLRGTADEVSAAQQAHDEAAIRKRYGKSDYKSSQKLENAYTARFEGLSGDNAKLKNEIDQFEKFGAVMDKSRLAVLNFDLAQGKLKGLSSGQIEALRSLAKQDDALDSNLKGMQAAQGIQKKVDALNAEAHALNQTKVATQEAALLNELDAVKTRISAQEYDRLRDAIVAASQARGAAVVADTLKKQAQATDDEVRKLRQESALLGMSTVERQKLAAVLKVEAEARKEIAQYPDQASAINATADQRKAQITSAIQDSWDYSRSAGVGSKEAFTAYVEQSSNAAKQVQSAWAGAFKGAENALVTFAETGKLDVRSFADSIIKELIRIEIQQQIMAPMTQWLGGILGIVGGGITGGLTGAGGAFSLPGSSGGGILGGGLLSGPSGAASIWPHANGGIMTEAGPMALRKYANGGIASAPQLALFGEGSKPEAYVPLPDGRTIPVTMKGQGNGNAGSINVQVIVNAETGATQTKGSNDQSAQQLGTLISAAVRAELIKQKRPGGLLVGA